jgi:hypothetical protein
MLGVAMRVAVCGMWLGSKVVAEIECVHNRCICLGRLYVANANVAATNDRESRPRSPTLRPYNALPATGWWH